jgi:hypothetical protein
MSDPPWVDPTADQQQTQALPPWSLGTRLESPRGSSIIDAGVDPLTIPGITPELRAGMERHALVDAAGRSRPQGAGWDVGAYEGG